jgi:hypothetical protein
MSVPTTMLTAEQARQIRDAMPVLSDRDPGIDLPTLLNDFAATVAACPTPRWC